MKIRVILLFVTGLTLANAYYDDDYDYRPYRRRPVYRRSGARRYRHPAYYAAQNSPAVNARGISFGSRGRYKGSMEGAGDGSIFGQRGGFKGSYAGDGQAEGGAKWDHEAISGGVRGQNRGSGAGAVMADTAVGGGSSKWSNSHDVGGETGLTWDNDDGGGDKGYMGNWN